VRDQRGFTLIEMMIVVAVISILALIAIPAFFSQSRKSKAGSETASMFAEMSTREEQYKMDFGAYLASPICPATPSSTLQSLTTAGCLTSASWSSLHINPPEQKVYCSYTTTVGLGGVAPTPPAPFTMLSDGTNPTPILPWYFIVATCDMDGNATQNSSYFMSSLDTRVQSTKEGY
jgi:prepilin-type N-terminal cleavage/methylation domain-containing protein